jgi:hypothetical protein
MASKTCRAMPLQSSSSDVNKLKRIGRKFLENSPTHLDSSVKCEENENNYTYSKSYSKI